MVPRGYHRIQFTAVYIRESIFYYNISNMGQMGIIHELGYSSSVHAAQQSLMVCPATTRKSSSLSILRAASNCCWVTPTCDCCLTSSNTASHFSWVLPFAFDWSSRFSSLASSCRCMRSELLTPVVKMLTSMIPVFGSVADCFRASRWSLWEDYIIIGTGQDC